MKVYVAMGYPCEDGSPSDSKLIGLYSTKAKAITAAKQYCSAIAYDRGYPDWEGVIHCAELDGEKVVRSWDIYSDNYVPRVDFCGYSVPIAHPCMSDFSERVGVANEDLPDFLGAYGNMDGVVDLFWDAIKPLRHW